ncbi:Protein of unknown function [Pyronema omphalodes CBS 100304]|uniref:Uncharacterized protein n=1 Tax=Pyronema omphalodes (strain CBS 100304) TaxID=1076935 RepID=U4LFJ5_PYROM|nr:Protein of unknown function [Pyronema omphalodes CBS 100304]
MKTKTSIKPRVKNSHETHNTLTFLTLFTTTRSPLPNPKANTSPHHPVPNASHLHPSQYNPHQVYPTSYFQARIFPSPQTFFSLFPLPGVTTYFAPPHHDTSGTYPQTSSHSSTSHLYPSPPPPSAIFQHHVQRVIPVACKRVCVSFY